MTQDDVLLFKDLCARLPYGVIGQCELDASYDTSFDTIFQTHKFDAIVYSLTEDSLYVYPLIENEDEQNFAEEEFAKGVAFSDFKPYLFPLSSINKEQQINLTKFVANGINGENILYDWYNKNHFDYRGLIEKGLAIDATGLNIYIKDR